MLRKPKVSQVIFSFQGALNRRCEGRFCPDRRYFALCGQIDDRGLAFATKLDSDDELGNGIAQCPTWHQMVKEGLTTKREPKPKPEPLDTVFTTSPKNSTSCA